MLSATQLVASSEESTEIRIKIDKVVSDLANALNFVTVVNALYCLCVLYAMVLTVYAIICIKRNKLEKKMSEAKLKAVKVEK